MQLHFNLPLPLAQLLQFHFNIPLPLAHLLQFHFKLPLPLARLMQFHFRLPLARNQQFHSESKLGSYHLVSLCSKIKQLTFSFLLERHQAVSR
jgi:hypothetical protein